MVITADRAPAAATAAPCPHRPPCPPADAVDHDAARMTACFPEQGWSRLCNGVIVFDDTGEVLPDGRVVEPRRGPAVHRIAGAAVAGC